VTVVIIICIYLLLVLSIGLMSNRLFTGSSKDYFLASHSIGPFLLLMSIFGTTMTAFALVGSTGRAYQYGIGVYGLMASWSGLIHSAVFFLVGIKLWGFGKKHGYVTQVQFFRDRFECPALGTLLFPILVAFVVPYLLIGILASGSVVKGVTMGAFPDFFAATKGGIPPALTGGVICAIVMTYVFFGGLRGTAWANATQTVLFMITALLAFYLISTKLGGLSAASGQVLEGKFAHPERLSRENMHQLHFFSYLFIPLSVGMFPHLFQHWLTAKEAKTFRATVILHPLFIMAVWVPCILIGIWATSVVLPGTDTLIVPALKGAKVNSVLAIMVKKLSSPIITGILSAGILAAIMSSLDSQFLCLGTMFTHDVVLHYFGKDRFDDKAQVRMARGFIVAIVVLTYLLSLFEPRQVFTLGVWCFSGFAALFPLVLASVYWRRATKAGAIACVLSTAAAWIILFANSGYGKSEGLVFHMMPVTFIFAASAISLVVVSLMTQPPSEETLAKFFPAKP